MSESMVIWYNNAYFQCREPKLRKLLCTCCSRSTLMLGPGKGSTIVQILVPLVPWPEQGGRFKRFVLGR